MSIMTSSNLSFKLPLNTKSPLDGLTTTEIIPAGTLERLVSSSLLKETFNNKYAGLIFKNERTQLIKLQSNLKGDLSQVKYKRASGMSYGRVNPVGAIGLASLRREIRHTLARDNYVDLDVDNAHPTFCKQYCLANGLDCGAVSEYVDNRDIWLARVSDAYLQDIDADNRRDVAKKLFIALMYHGSLKKWFADRGITTFLAKDRDVKRFLENFEEDFGLVAKTIIENNPKLQAEIAERKAKEGKTNYNEPGAVSSYFFQHIECQLLETMYNYAKTKGFIEDGRVVLCADGLMMRRDKYSDDLLGEFKRVILENHGLDVGVSQKLMTQGYTEEQITAAQIEDKLSDEPSYDEMKKFFERKHCKITSKALYICAGEEPIFYSELKIKQAYREVKYYAEVFNKKGKSLGLKPSRFIDKWLDDENLRKYEDVSVFPPPMVCPSDIYNLWMPFYIERFKCSYVPHDEGLKAFKSHILTLCDNAENVAEYFIKWLAQMFQFPAVKTIMPTFISEEGAGKGTLVALISSLMGSKKVLMTTDPARDVWGNFNSAMSSAFFVNLNEISPKDSKDCIGKIKGLITDGGLSINKKGVDVFSIQSCHRFLGSTQSEDPWKLKKDDRRNLVIRSSDELCGNKPHFAHLLSLFSDLSVQRTIYDYLMAIPDMDTFGLLPMPKVEYQEEVKKANRSVICRWVEDLAFKSSKDATLELDSVEKLQLFNKFCDDYGINYETSAIKMGIALNRLKIPGVITRHTVSGNMTSFDISTIRSHYEAINALDCQV